MDRRHFLKTTGTLVAASTLAGSGVANARTAPGTTRRVLPLNRNWRYSRTRVAGATLPGFDDSAFERVVVPHANVRLPWHSFDEQSYEFISVYRRRFKLPADTRGKRIFVDFEGVMTAATVWLNGMRLGEYLGGFTPFSFELTEHLDFAGENVLAVEVDSRERADIPPFGDKLDYLTFGGIYREVSLRIVSGSFIENLFAKPTDVLSKRPGLEVECFLEHLEPARTPLRLEGELLDGARVLARASAAVQPADGRHTLRFGQLPAVELWDIAHPKLYSVRVYLSKDGQPLDEDARTFGFRSARFTPHGFELNGKVLKLRGLNRHQTFPYVGAAMPARVQRRDAEILRKELKCNIVRTSHYPQSRHFLDACDELGLLVLEEIPGWQHIGDESWKALAVDNVRRMVRRDWNHPAIVLWGVRINESSDDHDFYTHTNQTAHELDPTRQTGGIRAFSESERLEDVFTMNDFGWPLKAPNHPCYLNTEFAGHTYNTKSTDDADRLMEHAIRHARVHDQIASDARYAGGIGWCAFDYNTHANFGSGDRMCYHGVADIFREPKLAAGFYRSQCDPAEEVVVAPAIHWAPSDGAGGLLQMMICSNCDELKLWFGDKLIVAVTPNRTMFPHLAHPPFVFRMEDALDERWGDMRIEGFIGGKQVIVKHYSGKGIDQQLVLAPDDARLLADGADATRVVLRVTDEFGNVRPLANDPITLRVEGPAELIGANPFALVGGVGAVWIRARGEPGTVRIAAIHPILGERSAQIEIAAASAETV
jgi:beta-galactosidase